MKTSRSICGLGLLALLALAGCAADTVTATFGGRQAAASSSSANVLYVRSGENQAIFKIDDAVVTVTQTQILFGNSVFTLPTDWKRVQLVGSRKSISIQVDGKPFQQLGPAA
jgi:hypothetical protein